MKDYRPKKDKVDFFGVKDNEAIEDSNLVAKYLQK